MKVTFAFVTTALLGAALAGCSSSSSTSGGAGAGTSQAASSGDIVVGAMTATTSQFGNFPQAISGVTAAARSFNAAGGIADAAGKRHKVVVDTCNTQGTADGEAACAAQLVADHVTAVVGDFSFANTGNVVDKFERAQLPDIAIGASTPVQYSTKIGFPLLNVANGALCATKAFQSTVAKNTNNKLAIVSLQVPSSKPQLDEYVKVAKAQGLDPIVIQPSPNTTDWSPVVQQMISSGANSILFNMTEPQEAPVVLLAKARGKNFTYCRAGGLWTPDQLKSLKDATSNFYFTAGFPPLSQASNYPLLKQFLADMKAAQAAGDPAADVTQGYDLLLNSWLGMYTLKQVVAGMHGTITNQSLLAATSKATVSYGGVIGAINFAKPPGGQNYPRAFNSDAIMTQWHPDTATLSVVPGISANVIQVINSASGTASS